MILCPYHSPQKYWEPVLIARWMGKGEINCKRTIGLKIIQSLKYFNVAASEQSLLELMLFLEKVLRKGANTSGLLSNQRGLVYFQSKRYRFVSFRAKK